MPVPEIGSPERHSYEQRIHRRIMDLVSNVAVRRRDLPHQVHALVYDEITQERFGSFVGVKYIGNSGLANITRTTIGYIAPGSTVIDIVDMLLENYSGTPLICDNKIAEELSHGSIPWIEEGHYRLEGRPGGVIEVYTPYQAIKLSESLLPPGTSSAQFFTE